MIRKLKILLKNLDKVLPKKRAADEHKHDSLFY